MTDKPLPREKAQLQALSQRLGHTDLAETEALVGRFPKPLWYINYRLDTGQPLEAEIPRIEQ